MLSLYTQRMQILFPIYEVFIICQRFEAPEVRYTLVELIGKFFYCYNFFVSIQLAKHLFALFFDVTDIRFAVNFLLIVPTFEETECLCLVWLFYTVNFRRIFFWNFLIFLEIKFKKIFCLRSVLQCFGCLKIAYLAMLWTNLCAL